ncbi:Uma2 family endonuclease [Thiohalocapsa sp. ML1]|uniref:Uma2 family endonuclease n=1 Tax=Thiohalocapsa sp. ML1 TaxID=1431688 RepID=UPI0007322EA8|nr:Uma2 family endonuclease [Thiohalocapsa sp. ML1]
MSTRPAIAEYPAEAPADHAEWVSETDYWCHYYADADRPYEWNNGHLEEKPVSDQGTYLVYQWFVELLRHYLREHPLGQLAALEMGFRLALPDRTVIRRPDLGLVLAANPAPLLPLDRSYHGIFDLCVEALSDEDRASIDRDLVTKKAEYAAAGVPEYYILHRTDGQLGFFGLSPSGVYQAIAPVDGVIQSRVLPGFQFRIDDLKRQPKPDRMLDDPVYPFVLPGWREADRRAAAAEATAAAAAERAAAEAERAELEAERAAAAEQRAQAAECELARLRAQAAGD